MASAAATLAALGLGSESTPGTAADPAEDSPSARFLGREVVAVVTSVGLGVADTLMDFLDFFILGVGRGLVEASEVDILGGGQQKKSAEEKSLVRQRKGSLNDLAG